MIELHPESNESLPLCEHHDEEQSVQICRHFFERLKSVTWNQASTYYWHFGDDSLVFDIVCEECSRGVVNPSELVKVCKDCGELFTGHSRPAGMIGGPRIHERHDSGVSLEHEDIEWPVCLPNVTAAKSLAACFSNHWLALSADQQPWRIDTHVRTHSVIANLTELFDSECGSLGLCVSSGGQLAAIYETHGSNGVVIDLASGRQIFKLHRGDYHCDVSRFSIAFFRHDDRDLLVHATNWNRLDISDPWTGKSLTERSPTSYSQGQERPKHYLDYFHCGLLVSSDDEWVVDNGWVWHPYGIVRSWNLNRWLNDNVWESESGPSIRSLCWRAYFWDGPICWVDSKMIAIWGYGDDDENLIPAVRLFNVETGKELRHFAGPPGLSAWNHCGDQRMRVVDSLLFDDYLFSFTPNDGFAIWDVADGARLFQQPDFCPIAYCRVRKEFFSRTSDQTIRLSHVRKQSTSSTLT